jgi:2-isopropylmalate synthase
MSMAGPRQMNQPGSRAGVNEQTRGAWNRQRASAMPSYRYTALLDRIELPVTQRAWPAERIRRAPLWCPVDLRDGNQALINPMDQERKLRLFRLMVEMGFKEIEVSYPASSEIDFEFVRTLIEHELVPEDVSIVVLTPARDELIDRTFAALEGVPRAVVHLYAATAPLWREQVLGLDRAGLRRLITDAAEQIQRKADGAPSTSDLRFEFSPETFSLTEPDVSIEVCNAVLGVWQPTDERPAIINLPSTVEVATPNVYADQIEQMSRALDYRSGVILSVHPHNDRGTAVAAAELALLAGAQRVEGCLFGNGERTGNVCLVTLALNLHSQGIDPEIDLSDIDHVRQIVEYANQLRVPDRHPYVGELVYTSFSGTHQDAINKVFAARDAFARETGVPEDQQPWEVPYLPIDPHDVGRNFEAVIRVNSQSGKGGVAYLLKAEHGLDLPRRLQAEFARTVQARSEVGGEISADAIWGMFQDEYLTADTGGRLSLRSYHARSVGDGREHLDVAMSVDGKQLELHGVGNGPIDAFVAALATVGLDVGVLDYVEHALGQGHDACAAAYVECSLDEQILWGVGLDRDIVRASLGALVSALNRTHRELRGSIAVAGAH